MPAKGVSKHLNYAGNDGRQPLYFALECGHVATNPRNKKCRDCTHRFCPEGHDKIIGIIFWKVCQICKNIKERMRYSELPPEKKRRRHLKSRYGITREDYDNLLKKQNNGCAICGIIPNKPLLVDHDHETGLVRKLLCYRCNSFLGYIEKGGLGLVRKALEYLSD